MNFGKPSAARLRESSDHPAFQSRLESRTIASWPDTPRAAPHYRSPARRGKLSAFFSEVQHPIAVGDRYEQMNGRKVGNLPDFGDVNSERTLRNACECSLRGVAVSIAQLYGLPRSDPQHARMLRRFVTECNRNTGRKCVR